MTGPLWDSGHAVHWTSIFPPAETLAEALPGVAFLWQAIFVVEYMSGLTKPLSRHSGQDHPTTAGLFASNCIAGS